MVGKNKTESWLLASKLCSLSVPFSMTPEYLFGTPTISILLEETNAIHLCTPSKDMSKQVSFSGFFQTFFMPY
jgi:hypothetical protein